MAHASPFTPQPHRRCQASRLSVTTIIPTGEVRLTAMSSAFSRENDRVDLKSNPMGEFQVKRGGAWWIQPALTRTRRVVR